MSTDDKIAAMFAVQSGSISPERMRATMDAYLESWRRNDPDARARLFTEAAVVEDPVGAPPYVGLDAIRGFWNQATSPDVRFDATLHKFIACGREALAHFTIGLKGGGRPDMRIEVHEALRFEDDGRISMLRAYWNQGNVSVAS